MMRKPTIVFPKKSSESNSNVSVTHKHHRCALKESRLDRDECSWDVAPFSLKIIVDYCLTLIHKEAHPRVKTTMAFFLSIVAC